MSDENGDCHSIALLRDHGGNESKCRPKKNIGDESVVAPVMAKLAIDNRNMKASMGFSALLKLDSRWCIYILVV
jgi:hypothetical protein